VRFEESFTVSSPQEEVWAFLEDVGRIARCVPGVSEVEPLEDGRSRVRMTQKVGPLSATFDLRTKMKDSEPGAFVEVESIGRSVKGALGELRSVNRVEIEAAGDDATNVRLSAEVAVGGMLGSVGTKVMSLKAKQVAKAFAANLEEQIHLFRASGQTT
jgi:carbon monoxide dehydrogenase subunit G